MANVLRIDPKKIGARPREFTPPVFDEDALARADDVLQEMSGSFQQWIEEETVRLQEARLAAAEANWSIASFEPLMLRAHDLKGLGGTYGYPLVTQIAGSLCRLIGSPEGRAAASSSPGLVCAHVDAIRAAVRDHVKTDADMTSRTLLNALNAQIDGLGLDR